MILYFIWHFAVYCFAHEFYADCFWATCLSSNFTKKSHVVYNLSLSCIGWITLRLSLRLYALVDHSSLVRDGDGSAAIPALTLWNWWKFWKISVRLAYLAHLWQAFFFFSSSLLLLLYFSGEHLCDIFEEENVKIMRSIENSYWNF